MIMEWEELKAGDIIRIVQADTRTMYGGCIAEIVEVRGSEAMVKLTASASKRPFYYGIICKGTPWGMVLCDGELIDSL